MRKLTLLLISALMIFSFTFSFAETENNAYGIWERKAFVDEFYDPTDEYYVVSNMLDGTFSNSATNDSQLSAYIFFYPDRNSIAIRLFEYGDIKVNNPLSQNVLYDLVFKDAEGNKYSTSGVMYSQSSDVLFSGGTAAGNLVYALINGGTVRFSLSEHNSSLTKYVFSIPNADGFEEAYYSVLALDPIVLNEGAMVYHADHGLGIVEKAYNITKDGVRTGTLVDVTYNDGVSDKIAYPAAVQNGILKIIVP